MKRSNIAAPMKQLYIYTLCYISSILHATASSSHPSFTVLHESNVHQNNNHRGLKGEMVKISNDVAVIVFDDDDWLPTTPTMKASPPTTTGPLDGVLSSGVPTDDSILSMNPSNNTPPSSPLVAANAPVTTPIPSDNIPPPSSSTNQPTLFITTAPPSTTIPVVVAPDQASNTTAATLPIDTTTYRK